MDINRSFSDSELEDDLHATKNRVPSDLETRAEKYKFPNVPETERRTLLADLQSKF